MFTIYYNMKRFIGDKILQNVRSKPFRVSHLIIKMAKAITTNLLKKPKNLF